VGNVVDWIKLAQDRVHLYSCEHGKLSSRSIKGG